MKRLNGFSACFLLVFAAFFISCDTAENIIPENETFVKLYGKDGDQFGVGIKEMPNNEFIILASYNKPVESSFLLFGIDHLGNEIWQQEYLPPDNTSEIPVALTTDYTGNIIVIGNSVSGSVSDIFVYKISPSGDVIQNIIYNVSELDDQTINRIDVAQDVIVDSENKIIISGYSKDGINNTEEFFAVKLNEQLVLENDWSRIIHPSDEFTSGNYKRIHSRLGFTNDRIITLSTSEFFAGETAPDNLNIEIFFLNKQYGTADFNTTGTSFIGTDFHDEINSFTPTLNGFAFIGTTVQTLTSSLIIGELGTGGIKINEFSLSTRNLKGLDIARNEITGRLVLLAEEIISVENKNIHMAEVDNTGNVIWEHAYGGNDIDDAAALYVKNNSIYILGTLKMNSQNKVVLIKTDGEGKL